MMDSGQRRRLRLRLLLRPCLRHDHLLSAVIVRLLQSYCNAVILQYMHDDVNTSPPMPSLREAQIAHTEDRIIAAATELFLADGYVATTLEAVAGRAQVGPRTVYVRFGTKAALFKRVVDSAVVGDTLPIPVLERDWAQVARTAPTASERIAASALITR